MNMCLQPFQEGADGYCLKNDTHAELVMAIKRVLSGKKFISPEIAEKILEGYLDGKKSIKSNSAWETLTQREKEVCTDGRRRLQQY